MFKKQKQEIILTTTFSKNLTARQDTTSLEFLFLEVEVMFSLVPAKSFWKLQQNNLRWAFWTGDRVETAGTVSWLWWCYFNRSLNRTGWGSFSLSGRALVCEVKTQSNFFHWTKPKLTFVFDFYHGGGGEQH
jgi:hypothetical protein